jgi:hypothetical protein
LSQRTTETFFRPPELQRRSVTLPAALLNGARLLLARSGGGCLFVPIRNMQFLAVVDREETVFVDSQAYAVQDGAGGRLILIAWRPQPSGSQHSLSEPVPCDLIYYRPGLDEVQRRLVGELGRALQVLGERQGRTLSPTQGPRILPFRSPVGRAD